MNANLKRQSLRVINCEFGRSNVYQKQYGTNSIGESVWGCITECPYVFCEYNLNYKTEGLRRNLFGRAGPWL